MYTFSIPYNGYLDPDAYLEAIKPYAGRLDSVYFSIPSIFRSHQEALPDHVLFDGKHDVEAAKEMADKNTKALMQKSKGTKFKRVLALNCVSYDMSVYDACVTAERCIAPLVDDGMIDEVILSDPTLAVGFRRVIPGLVIQPSCNTNCFTTKHIQYWMDEFGAKTVNLPREAVRNIPFIEEVKKLGVRTKVICNDYCLYGCPQCAAHVADIAYAKNKRPTCYFCHQRTKYSDIFKLNTVPPHKLCEYAGLVDVFKIVGRQAHLDDIVYRLDAYYNEKPDANIVRLYPSQASYLWEASTGVEIRADKTPKRSLTCNLDCKNCTPSGKQTCREKTRKILESAGITVDENLL